MERLLMKKFLIWTALVLAALTACNKEIETPVVDNGQEEVTPGKVILTFTAAIGDETRTAYADDKTASWAVGDIITVCLTNADNSDYQIVEFEAKTATQDGMEFTGEVDSDFTTIVSGIYPTNDIYTDFSEAVRYFNIDVDENDVIGDGSVIGIYLPDEYDLGDKNDTGIAIPMVGKIENGAFTFRHICGALKIEVVDIFNSLTFTTSGQTITGDFELDGNGRINIPENGSTSTVTFNYNRLSTNPDDSERGNRTFYIPVPYGTLNSGATMELKKSDGTTVYEKTTPQSITFSNNIMRMKALSLQTPSGWSNSVTEGATATDKGKYTFRVPTGTEYVYLFTTSSNFKSTYHGSVAEFIEQKALTNQTYTTSGNKTMTNTMDHYYGQEYVVLTCAITKVDGKRRITFDHCLLYYQFPTENYLKWIGDWLVEDPNGNIDTWTITRKETNATYTVTGLCGNTTNPKKVEALYDAGSLKFMSQFDFTTVTYKDGTTYLLSLIGYKENTGTTIYNSYNPYELMGAQFTDNNVASLTGSEFTYQSTTFNFSKYNLSRKIDHASTPSAYGTARYLPATMTRVTE